VRDVVVNGLGVGVLPLRVAVDEVARGRLVPILPQYITVPETMLYAVYPSREYLPPKVRVLLDWLIVKFPFQSKK
jgi:DNA-binding transcriptional LysR family regulator